MANTYEDTKGNTFSSYQDALTSNQSLSSSSLTPTKPIQLSPVAPATQSTGLEAYLGSLSTSLLKAQETKEASQQDYLSALLGEGEAGATNRLYDQAGVNTADAELKDINNQILAEQEGTRRQLEAIEKNPEGLFGGALQDKMNDIRDESLSRQADMAVIQLSKQGKFDSAKQIADRAVAALMERRQNKLLALREIYNENKDSFDKSEQRIFETMQGERERALANEEYRLRAEFDQKMQQSDPLYRLKLERERREIALLGQPTAAEKKATEAALKEARSSVPVMQDKIAAIDVLKNHKGMAATVGPNIFARELSRLDALTGVRQEFIGGVEKLVSGLTLDSLIEAKKRGATFGALSDSELKILAAAASAIKTWEMKDKNGNVTGYNVTESVFKKELDTIKAFTERALLQSGQNLISQDESDLLDQLMGADSDPSSYF